ncbi:hypothetical protein [Trabulsiella odontotermitis]|uniref:hypothetical protein n=1 Tax=Trabulsiella odontotermitis TaxID=379893 RepID=UPI000675EF37|nr:hypothetical protein [Trabulsiella odontotermitis]KNC89618.1 hypothetical protein GM30_07135 [Trabulsiella odontotermitis]
MKINAMFSALLVSSALFLSACDSADSTDSDKATKILDGKASVVLPEGFVKMPKELMDKKYTNPGQRPQEAWYVESEGGKVTLAFAQTDNRMTEAQLPQFATVLKTQMSAFSPAVSDVTVDGKKMTRLEMTTPSPDGKIFNVMQISSMDGKLMISTFNATEDIKDKYAQAGRYALSTLKY